MSIPDKIKELVRLAEESHQNCMKAIDQRNDLLEALERATKHIESTSATNKDTGEFDPEVSELLIDCFSAIKKARGQ